MSTNTYTLVEFAEIAIENIGKPITLNQNSDKQVTGILVQATFDSYGDGSLSYVINIKGTGYLLTGDDSSYLGFPIITTIN